MGDLKNIGMVLALISGVIGIIFGIIGILSLFVSTITFTLPSSGFGFLGGIVGAILQIALGIVLIYLYQGKVSINDDIILGIIIIVIGIIMDVAGLLAIIGGILIILDKVL